MRETGFLQMCSFSIILASLHSLNLSFPLLFYVTSSAVPKFPIWFPTSPPWFRTFTQFPFIYIPFLAFPPLFSAFL